MKYIVEFEDEPCMYEDEVHFYKCIQAPWLGLSEKVIKQLTPYQPEPDCVSRKTALDAFGLSEKTRKYGGDHSGYDTRMLYEIQDTLENLPAVQPDHTADSGKKVCVDTISRQAALKKLAVYIHLIDKTMGKGLLTDDDCMEAAKSVLGEDEIPAVQPATSCSEIPNSSTDCISRQAAIDAYGDWYVEEGTEEGFIGTVKQLLEGLPSAQPATNCSEIPNGSDDTISRQVAIDALARMMPRSYTPDGSHPADEEIFRAQEVFADCIEALEILPSAQPEQRWIPVTERLPENDNEVLITVWDAEDDYVEVYKGFYQGHEWWTQWCHGCSKIKDEPCGENIVIAWMPLPEPYQGGEK